MSITASAVLCEMNISVWTANKLDKGETEKVTVGASAVKDAAQVRKNLMAGTSMRKDIADYAAGCRLWHNTRTLPWADKGARLMPTSLFMDYKAEANVRRDTFNQMVDNFVAQFRPRRITWAHCSTPMTIPMLKKYEASSGFGWCSLPYRNQVTFVFRLGNKTCKTYEISTKRISMTA